MFEKNSLPDRAGVQRHTELRRQKADDHGKRLQSQRRRSVLPIAFRLLGGLIIVLGIGAMIGLLALDRTYKGRIISNVAIQGLDVSQREPAVARAALRSRYGAFLKKPITFQFEGRTWQPTLEQLGIHLAISEAVDQAYTAGRSVNLFKSLPEAYAIWRDGLDIPVELIVDQHQLQSYLLERAQEIEQAPRNADLTIVQGHIRSTTALAGRQLLIDETAQDVMRNLHLLQPQTITLRTRTLRPLIEDAGIADAQRQLSSLLQSDVTLTANNQQWTWTPEELGNLVHIAYQPNSNGQTHQLTASIDRALLEQRIQQFAPTIDATPVEPRLRFTNNGLQITRAGENGAQLQVTQATDELNAALWQDQRTIALPVAVLKPQARPETLNSLGIVDLVAQGKSSFENSAAYRTQNIIAGAQQMEGVLIAPGEEFSFNNTVGNIDESNGFTEGYAIVNGRTQLEWGGGVCQVSTTVFRAAFWAGIPITERNQHSFRIRWYEKFEPIGMDAAIFTGPNGYDLRFVNDTEHWLLMQTVVDTKNEVLTVNLYGTKTNREVIQTPAEITREVPAPTKPRYVNDPTLPAGTIKQTDTARGGMDVRVGRIVKQDGQTLFKDTFFSRFQPWPNIYTRGTGSS